MAQRRVRVGKDGRPVPEVSAPSPSQLPEAAPACDCPVLDPDDWHEAESDWADITFLRLSIPALGGIPIGHNTITLRAQAEAGRRGFAVPDDPMVLIGQGMFRRPVLFEVEAPPDAPGVVRPGGFAFSRLLSAPPGEVRRLADETSSMAVARYGRKPDSHWLWLLTCRGCDAARGYETLFVVHYAPGRAGGAPHDLPSTEERRPDSSPPESP